MIRTDHLRYLTGTHYKAKKPKEEATPALPTPEEMLSKTASLLEELKRVCNIKICPNDYST